MFFSKFFWKEVLKNLMELSDDSKIEKLIEKRMILVIKKKHPKDYKDFVKRNKKRLEEIKLELKEKYSKEIRQKILSFSEFIKGA